MWVRAKDGEPAANEQFPFSTFSVLGSCINKYDMILSIQEINFIGKRVTYIIGSTQRKTSCNRRRNQIPWKHEMKSDGFQTELHRRGDV